MRLSEMTAPALRAHSREGCPACNDCDCTREVRPEGEPLMDDLRRSVDEPEASKSRGEGRPTRWLGWRGQVTPEEDRWDRAGRIEAEGVLQAAGDCRAMEPKEARMGPPYRHVIFDLDGTLINSQPGILAGIRHALARLGHELPGDIDLDWAIGPPLEEVMARLLAPLGDERITLAVSSYREDYGTVGLFEVRPYEGIPALLGDLAAAGRSLFVGTSKLTPFARTVLGHFGLADHFAGIYGAEPHGRFKHKADLIRHILGDRRLDPKETIMVGDREHDVSGARANGVAVISVTYGYGAVEELRTARASVLCDAPWRLRDPA